MRKELQLGEVHGARELQNDLLGVLAKLFRLPPLRIHGRVKQLGDGVLGVFAATVDDLEGVLYLVWLQSLHLCLNSN